MNMELGYKWDCEIRDRCKNNNIDIDDCYIMFSRCGEAFFCGQKVPGFTESKDERWICIPVEDEETEVAYGEYCYKPECFEVRHKMSTYLSNGTMWALTYVWALEK